MRWTSSRALVVSGDHRSKDGTPKIAERCTLPVTGAGVVDPIITDLAIINVTEDGLVLRDTAPGVDVEEPRGLTSTHVLVPVV